MSRTAPRDVREWARRAEEAGVGSVWFPEDYYFASAFGLASAAAAVTSRVTVGVGVVNPYTRHPALIAMEAATLAGLAPERVILGLGSGVKARIEQQMAIPHTAPLQTLRESVEIIRRLWRGDRVTFEGKRFSVKGAALDVERPQPDLPLFLGVKGWKAVETAAEIADGITLSALATPPHVARVREQVARVRRAAGQPTVTLSLAAYVPTVVGGDSREARQAVKPLIARYLGLLHGQSILIDAGLPESVTLPFRQALLAGTAAESLVGDDLVERVAIAGSPDECRAALRRYAEAGLDVPVVYVPSGVDWAWQFSLIARELVPFWEETRRSREGDRQR